jgi:hypothetical protein
MTTNSRLQVTINRALMQNVMDDIALLHGGSMHEQGRSNSIGQLKHHLFGWWMAQSRRYMESWRD